MSIECGECERDLRGSHEPGCSRYRICKCGHEAEDHDEELGNCEKCKCYEWTPVRAAQPVERTKDTSDAPAPQADKLKAFIEAVEKLATCGSHEEYTSAGIRAELRDELYKFKFAAHAPSAPAGTPPLESEEACIFATALNAVNDHICGHKSTDEVCDSEPVHIEAFAWEIWRAALKWAEAKAAGTAPTPRDEQAHFQRWLEAVGAKNPAGISMEFVSAARAGWMAGAEARASAPPEGKDVENK